MITSFQKLKDFHWCEGRDPESFRARFLQKTKWMISIARNCIVIVVSAGIAFYLVEVWHMDDVLILTGKVD